jgi:deoxyribonucleoside regulator
MSVIVDDAAPLAARERRLSEADQERLADVADRYYVRGMDQLEIASGMGVSRSSVSRMLSLAVAAGIVEFRINRPTPIDTALQDRITRAFPNVEAIVLDGSGMDGAVVPARVGQAAAQRLGEWTRTARVLGISWGSALRHLADALTPVPRPTLEVVQLMGGVGSLHPEIDGEEVGRTVAQKLGARYRYLSAPLLVSSTSVAAALRSDSSIRSVLDLGVQSDIALVGLGTLHPEESSLLRAGYQTAAELRANRDAGAVGDVCGHHLDAEGAEVDLSLHERLLSISLDDLRRIPTVVAVASGARKAEIILAVLRAGLVDVVVTDDAAASGVAAKL